MDRRRPRRQTPSWPARAPAVHIALALLALFLITSATAQPTPPPVSAAAINVERPPQLLSAYRFFRDAAAREPNEHVTPYDLNTALYSDGALKFRYVYVPTGVRAQYRADGVFEFPVGTVLIKTFAFAADMRTPTENVRFLETRLLIRRESGWVALPYVWNAAQTEARYSPIGADLPVSLTDEQGQALALDWHVPNVNECSGCHMSAGAIEPIGPSARNLNRTHDYGDLSFASERVGAQEQLRAWAVFGILGGLSPDRPDGSSTGRPHVPNAYDATSGPLETRARAYLDVNCAHCHNPDGPAHTSGLDLSWSQNDPSLWGVGKRPVAAGRGSAGYEFAIEPGHPERSILLHRMESIDPGVMMPELGRRIVDRQGTELIRQWIANMDANGRSQ